MDKHICNVRFGKNHVKYSGYRIQKDGIVYDCVDSIHYVRCSCGNLLFSNSKLKSKDEVVLDGQKE